MGTLSGQTDRLDGILQDFFRHNQNLSKNKKSTITTTHTKQYKTEQASKIRRGMSGFCFWTIIFPLINNLGKEKQKTGFKIDTTNKFQVLSSSKQNLLSKIS